MFWPQVLRWVAQWVAWSLVLAQGMGVCGGLVSAGQFRVYNCVLREPLGFRWPQETCLPAAASFRLHRPDGSLGPRMLQAPMHQHTSPRDLAGPSLSVAQALCIWMDQEGVGPELSPQCSWDSQAAPRSRQPL